SAEAMRHLKAAVEFAPAQGRYWLSYAEGLLASGNVRDALAVIDEAGRRGIPDMHVDALRERAVSSQSSGPSQSEIDGLMVLCSESRHAEAETVAKQMIQGWPHHGFGWKALGTVLIAQRRMAEALPVLQKTLALLPLDPETRNSLGVVLHALGRLQEAEACFRAALLLKPDFHETHNNLGNVLQT